MFNIDLVWTFPKNTSCFQHNLFWGHLFHVDNMNLQTSYSDYYDYTCKPFFKLRKEERFQWFSRIALQAVQAMLLDAPREV